MGGQDKSVTIYSIIKGVLKESKKVIMESQPRSLDLYKGEVLCGLKNGSISTIALAKVGEDDPSVVMRSHCDGECWGLEVIHLPEGEIRVLTAADDNRILAYNLKKRGCLAEGKVCIDPPKK